MEYRLERLDDRTCRIVEYDASASVYMYLLAGDREAVLIDSGFGTNPLDKICGALTDRPVSVVLTHAHADHIGGCGRFERVLLHEADAPLYRLHGAGELRRRFTGDPLYPVRERPELFAGEPVLDLGGRTVRVLETPGHTVGSVCLLDVERRRLFAGDSCCRAHVLLQMEYSAGLEAFAGSMRKLLDHGGGYDEIWPGHHAVPVGKEIPRQFLEAAEGLLNGTLRGSAAELPMGQARLLEYGEIGVEY